MLLQVVELTRMLIAYCIRGEKITNTKQKISPKVSADDFDIHVISQTVDQFYITQNMEPMLSALLPMIRENKFLIAKVGPKVY